MNSSHKITHVVFDCFGVLFDWRPALASVSDVVHTPQAKVHELIRSKLGEVESGNLNSDNFWQNILTQLEPTSKENLATVWFDHLQKIEPSFDLASKLKAAGVKIAICTNGWSGGIDFLTQKFPELVMFDPIIDSTKIGLVKPDFEMYMFVENKLGVRGQEILLIDDSKTNVDAASSFGWGSFWFKSEEGDYSTLCAQIAKLVNL